MQTKIFPRQLLDFKARLLLGKTQFGKTLAKWTNENISQGCKVCLSKGDFQYDDLSHRLITCPTSNTIVEYIKSCLTKQVQVTLTSIVLTNRRCIHQVNISGHAVTGPTTKHKYCAVYEKETLDKTLGFKYVWTNYMQYIMKCSHENSTPNKEDLEYILNEIRYLTRARPNNLVSIFLENLTKNMNRWVVGWFWTSSMKLLLVRIHSAINHLKTPCPSNISINLDFLVCWLVQNGGDVTQLRVHTVDMCMTWWALAEC